MQRFVILFLLLITTAVSGQSDSRNNILFLAVDDLKPLLASYGHTEVHSPNFDRLARMGVTFTNAHVQYAVCGPSRASIMTGTYPDRTRVWDLHTDFRKSNPDLISMPEHLVQQGYTTVGIGKIYHKGSSSPGHDGKSWSMGHTLPRVTAAEGEPIINYQSAENRKRYEELFAEARAKGVKGGKLRKYALDRHKPSTESAPVGDFAYQDGAYTQAAVSTLKKLSGQQKPWFLALGFQRPHLPFVAPQQYWDLYEREEIDLAKFQSLAQGTPTIAYHNFGELRSYTDINNDARPGSPLPEAKQRELIHGYLAAVAYVDALLGHVLDALEAHGQLATTNIVLWGDHGFHLGDHTLWCKHSNFEQATRIPFFFAGPGVAAGKQVDHPVNLIDAFPTLFDLAGVKASKQTEGKSLTPLLDNDPATSLEMDYAISQYRRMSKRKEVMGYALRTDRYRYTEWHQEGRTLQAYDAAKIVERELYDYEKDPLETKNLVDDPTYRSAVSLLEAKLKTHWQEQHAALTGQKPVKRKTGGQKIAPTTSRDLGLEDKRKSKLSNTRLTPDRPVRKAGKPNILFIHTDDLGYHDLSHTGSKLYQTPHIDRLAEEGVNFTQAYSNYPRCTPSRYALMTGTYPVNEDYGHLTGIPEQKNFAKLFDQAGYQTLFVGKWHLGHDNNSPTAFGFKESYAAGHAGGVGQRFYPFNVKKNGKRHKEQVPDVEKDCEKGDYISDVLTDQTLDWMKMAKRDQPFMAVLSFYAVHTPLEAKPADRARNAVEVAAMDFGDTPAYIKEGAGRRKMRQDDPDYAGMVENVDENVGRLLRYLDESGLAENTIVVFSSDHGGLSNDGHARERHLATSNLPLRAGKGWLYEGGIRVPLIFRWPARIQPQREESSIVLGMDVMPTLLDLAADVKVDGIDGKSAESVLLGKEKWDERTVFWHSRKARPHSTGDAKMSVVRAGDYKLITYNETGAVELYHLRNDPGEERDLSASEPARVEAMRALLDNWKKNYLVPEKTKLKQKAAKH